MANYFDSIINRGDWQLGYDPFEDEYPDLAALTGIYRTESGATDSLIDAFLHSIDPYNRLEETLAKEEIGHRTKSNIAELAIAHIDSIAAKDALSQQTGQFGFTGSGKAGGIAQDIDKMFSRQVEQTIVDVNKDILKGKDTVRDLRMGYIDDLWGTFDYFQRTAGLDAAESEHWDEQYTEHGSCPVYYDDCVVHEVCPPGYADGTVIYQSGNGCDGTDTDADDGGTPCCNVALSGQCDGSGPIGCACPPNCDGYGDWNGDDDDECITGLELGCPSDSDPMFDDMGGTLPSDIRLKENIELVGQSNSGINIYEFDYKDKLYGEGRYRGVVAQEVPEVAQKETDGYLWVDYNKLDVDFEIIDEQRRL